MKKLSILENLAEALPEKLEELLMRFEELRGNENFEVKELELK